MHCLPIAGQQPTAVTQVDGQTTPPHTAQPAPLSSADIRRYERRLQEGYDLPDPRYLEWKDSTMRALPEEDLSRDVKLANADTLGPESGLGATPARDGTTVFVQEYARRRPKPKITSVLSVFRHLKSCNHDLEY